MKVAVVGANGQLGTDLVDSLAGAGHEARRIRQRIRQLAEQRRAAEFMVAHIDRVQPHAGWRGREELIGTELDEQLSRRLNAVVIEPGDPAPRTVLEGKPQLVRTLVDTRAEVAVLVREPVFLAPVEVEPGRDVGQRQPIADCPVQLTADEGRLPVSVLRRDRAKRGELLEITQQAVVPGVRIRKDLAFRVA